MAHLKGLEFQCTVRDLAAETSGYKLASDERRGAGNKKIKRKRPETDRPVENSSNRDMISSALANFDARQRATSES